MRIDPESVYLEVQASSLIYNFETGKERYVPAVTLHFKDGRKWQRRSFVGREDESDTLGSILERLGRWFDQHGIDGALDQAMGREAADAA